MYATTAPDETDPEEILTYEEVALYYPRATHKRPIVLIGPPNIGRHELRQRLMADSERFSAAVPRKYIDPVHLTFHLLLSVCFSCSLFRYLSILLSLSQFSICLRRS